MNDVGVVITTQPQLDAVTNDPRFSLDLVHNYTQPVDNVFSPRTLDEYIGQKDAKAMVKIIIAAANKEHRSLPNILIVSGFGLGKTTLAKLILQTAGQPVIVRDAASLSAENLPASGTIIVDEMHNLKAEVSDSLNVRIDSGQLVLIGCTTNPGRVPSAFRSRFRTIYLSDYTPDDLANMLHQVSTRKGTYIDYNLLSEIAKRSRRNARAAIQNLSFIFDFASANALSVDSKVVCNAFEMLGVDEKGFLERDHAYVNALMDRPVGLQYLASKTGIDAKTIEEEVEPYLLQMGIIDRTPKGRVKLRDL